MEHTRTTPDQEGIAELESRILPPPAGDPNLIGAPRAELETFAVELGESKFRGTQIFEWAQKKQVTDFGEMTNLGKKLRERLQTSYRLALPKLVAHNPSGDGTAKYVFESNGSRYEAVFIPEVAQGAKTNTLCISSQTGCAVGCKFCFTASLKRHRNLTAAEIVGQVRGVQAHQASLAEPKSVTNIVFMGMGEPLLNLDNVTRSIQVLTDSHGVGFAERRITVSTAGIVPRIRELGAATPVQLALSLNATTDEVRNQVMPINRRWGIQSLIDALHAYPLAKRRRFTIEYVLLKDVNDSVADARRLPGLLEGLPVKINLLPLNPHDQTPYETPPWERVETFQKSLQRAGMTVLVRRPRGQDVAAACGQLGGDVTI